MTCRVAPHHFLSLPRFLSEVVRVLKPGGRFLLADTSVPDEDPIAGEWQNRVESLRDPSHVRNRSPREWQALMEQAGLDLKEIIGPVGDISIMLDDWIVKAGCTPEQEAQVRHAFATAPSEAISAFQIEIQVPGGTIFKWQRVVARAVKS